MLHKLKQQTTRYKRTVSNRVPNRRARHFLKNYLRLARAEIASYKLRGALGLIRWTIMHTFHEEDRISSRSGCFISGRARGTSQRYTVSRTKIKTLSDEGKLIGIRKSSW